MDLLGKNPAFNLHDPSARIYSRNEARPPQRMGKKGRAVNSLVTEGCEIDGTVENCVLSAGVKVHAGAVVRDSVLMEDVVIGEGSTVAYSMIADGVQVGKNCTVGAPKNTAKGVTVVAGIAKVPDGTTVEDGAMADAAYFETHTV